MIFNEETREMLQMVRDFVDKEIIPTVGEYEKSDVFPQELLDKACDMGLNALCVPAEYGGPGLTNVQVFAIAEEIAYKNGWITKEKLLESAERYGKSPYGEHLKRVAEGKILY